MRDASEEDVQMQQPELVPILSIPVVISAVTVAVILNTLRKTRPLPAVLYTVAAICFLGMSLDLLLDQAYMPFREAYISVNGHILWWSNTLNAFFIVIGFLAWYLAIQYSQRESLPDRTLFVSFLIGASLFSELMKMSWSDFMPLIVEIPVFTIMIIEIILYAVRVLPTTQNKRAKTHARLYFVGIVVWFLAAPIGIIIPNIEGTPEWMANLWTIPYSAGFLLLSIALAKEPRLLFISSARVLDLMILDRENTLIFVHRFMTTREGVDPELMGSAMSGVMTLIREMLASTKQLHRIDHGDTKILFETGMLTTFLLVVTQETVRFRQVLRALQIEFEANYREEILSKSPFVNAYSRFKERVIEAFQ